jgi:hypothetical protein
VWRGRVLPGFLFTVELVELVNLCAVCCRLQRCFSSAVVLFHSRSWDDVTAFAVVSAL